MSSEINNNNNKKRKSSGLDAAASNTNNNNNCPYLDTIQRSLLDFDFEPSCSVSLESGPHVYGCLVCGKFFRGRGKNTPALTHSVDDGHYVFVHLTKGTFHCLPEDYEIKDSSLADISAALHPTYTTKEILSLDANTQLSRDLFGRRYLPGYVGLNNLHKTDCVNSVVQALVHVRPLRDYFLSKTHKDIFVTTRRNNKNKPPHKMSHLVQCFGELVRKIWSDKRFKSNVDPHMLIQAISSSSKKKFQVGVQAEAGEFMAWFLNQLHIGLGGSRKPNSSIIYKCFQGKVEVTTRQRKSLMSTSDDDDEQAGTKKQAAAAAAATSNNYNSEENNDNKNAMDIDKTEDESESKKQQQNQNSGESTTEGNNNDNDSDNDDEEMSNVMETNFLQLTLDIPEKPLFRDDDGGLVIPQEPLVTVLKKFDGMTFADALNSKSGVTAGQRKKYRLLELPPYLILHLSRFKTNQYSREKNPTIVAFPVKNLDLSSYVFPKTPKESPPTEEEVKNMDVKQLKELLTKYGRQDIASQCLEKSELVEATINFVTKSLPDLLADKYDLVANITHDSPADVGREGKTDPLQEGSYKCHVCHQTANQWYELQDLHVQETMPQLIGVSESYLLIFERKSAQQQAKIATIS